MMLHSVEDTYFDLSISTRWFRILYIITSLAFSLLSWSVPHSSSHRSAVTLVSRPYVLVQKRAARQGLDFDANQRIDSRRDSRHTIAARIKVDSRERYHDYYLGLYFDHFFLVTNYEHLINKNV